MPNIAPRQIEGQELLDISFNLANYAFRPTPPFPDRQEWEARHTTRQGPLYYALFEDDDPVAVAGCPTMAQNLRGEIFQMAGFADISTHPKARRKGYIRALMRYAYQQLKNHGYIFSCLYPFRESFYERLGYVTFPQSRQAIFKPTDLRSLFNKELGGQAELALIGEVYDDYRSYALEMQARVHGMAVFKDSQKESVVQSNHTWLLQARVEGHLVGVMSYSLKGDEMMNYTLQASRFYYSSSQGKYLLLEWIARHIDQAGEAKIWLPAYEQPNTWLSDIKPKLEPVFVAPMGRVLDIAGIGGMGTKPGSFSAKISDPDCPWNNGTWKFEGDSGKLEIFPAQTADCHLTIQGLSALVYGVNDPEDFTFRGWGDPSPRIITVMRRMFPPQLPYLHEYY